MNSPTPAPADGGQTQAPASQPPSQPTAGSSGGGWLGEITHVFTQRGPTGPRGGRGSESIADAMVKSAARAVGSTVGRQIVRGVLGSILGGVLGGKSSRG